MVAIKEDASGLEDSIPLCVDLDGTLVKSDTLHETLLLVLKTRPLSMFALALSTLRGKAYFKSRVARLAELNPALLPYNEALLAYLREQHSKGRYLVLATATNEKLATRIAAHLGIFSEVIASNASENLSGEKKLIRLRERFGEKFEYAANAHIDMAIWRHAHAALLVNPDAGLERRVRRSTRISEIFETRRSRFGGYLRLLRIHQWLKNLLVFVPLLAGHVFDATLIAHAGLAFLAFSLCASSGYIINDMLDLTSDRLHAEKRYRPLAAGNVSIVGAALMISGLLAVSFTMSAIWLPTYFSILLGLYFGASMTYSMALKKLVLVDVLALASLYTSRVLAGGAAISIVPSFWLLAFSMFLFLSLAMVKRTAELLEQKNVHGSLAGRGYDPTDINSLRTMGVTAGYLSVLVVALYINSDEVIVNYASPRLLWLICPLLLYWISRSWMKTDRGEMHHDPLVYAIRDPVSLLMGAGMLTVLFLAI